MYTGYFTWQQHGPKDYADAAAFVARLPAEERHKLNGKVKEALEWIVTVFASNAQQGTGSVYLSFSRARLATFLRRSLRTVDRILCHLQKLGYIRRQRRTPIADSYQTALTFPGKSLLAHLYRSTKAKLQRFRPATKAAHNELKKENKTPDARGGGLISPSESTRTTPPDRRPDLRSPASGSSGPEWHPSHRPWKAPDWMTGER